MDMLRDSLDMSDKSYAVNYMTAVGAEGDSVMLRDEITGEEIAVKPKVVVNAGGPWIDFANQAMGEPTRFIGGTKGSHIILDNPELFEALNGTEMFFENADGRILLILPYLGKVMAGTTDIRIEDPEEAWIVDDEIDYILGAIPHVFPTIPLDRSQIVFQFSGVRPLANSGEGYTGNVTRDHQIMTIETEQSGFGFPIYSLVGGKWTSFRAFSEQTADQIMQTLNITRKQSTEHMPIGGGKDYPQNEAETDRWITQVADTSGVAAERVRTLFERYGTHAENITIFISEGEDQPIADLPDYSVREIRYLAKTEQVTHLTDIPLRRTLIGWLGQLTDAAVVSLANAAGEELGWSDARRQEEIERTVAIFNDKYAGRLTVAADGKEEAPAGD